MGVEQGRDGVNRPSVCMVAGAEVWCVFNDMMGICFRRRTEEGKQEFNADEMKKLHQGVYRVLAQKWNAVCAVIREEPKDAP